MKSSSVPAGTILLLAALAATFTLSQGLREARATAKGQTGFSGSQSCRTCHERFYQLWAPSHHGRAMQDYSDDFAAANLRPQTQPLTIKGRRYLVRTGPGQGFLLEMDGSAQTRHPIRHVLGGKNVYYFLTPMARGRLQTLPLAYDINTGQWFDTAASGLRHAADEPLDWRDSVYTFNTACHSCHVSQFARNYDPATDTYATTWSEPGINCETCHGPGGEHIRVCEQAPAGSVPADLKIIRGGRDFTADRNNAVCSSCHAKMIPLTDSFKPGEGFFDHFDISLLEHPDYFPDGRDLGENYTCTSWLMSPCVAGAELDCLHCHTSSGRFRQKKNPNSACLPCHAGRVAQAEVHTRHQADSEGNKCIACHMPTTGFARMRRSDHSMLPPAPAATIRFGSPNACTGCHPDKDAAWADELVRQWHTRDYQAPVLARAGLIQAARGGDWSRLEEMTAYLLQPHRDQVTAASLVRLLRACPDRAKWPALLRAARDASPLVRASAMEALGGLASLGAVTLLQAGMDDEVRLVRIRAARFMVVQPPELVPDSARVRMRELMPELEAALMARPDVWDSHYNFGNLRLAQQQLPEALAAYDRALSIDPRALAALVNAAMAAARLGDNGKALDYLNRALDFHPDSAAVHYNLGLLQVQLKNRQAAVQHLRAALESDPRLAGAAGNLGILLADEAPRESLELLERAYELRPDPACAYSLAFFLVKNSQRDKAAAVLSHSLEKWPDHGASYLLLADVHLKLGDDEAAKKVLLKGLARSNIDPGRRQAMRNTLNGLGR